MASFWNLVPFVAVNHVEVRGRQWFADLVLLDHLEGGHVAGDGSHAKQADRNPERALRRSEMLEAFSLGEA